MCWVFGITGFVLGAATLVLASFFFGSKGDWE